ncbi:MAG: hypothetical protein ABR574_00745, partial [Cryomorphaceae bacterium]
MDELQDRIRTHSNDAMRDGAQKKNAASQGSRISFGIEKITGQGVCRYAFYPIREFEQSKFR